MLPEHTRLKGKKAYSQVFRVGKPFFFRSLGCKIEKDSCLKNPKIGVSVGKKYLTLAVDRHIFRRRLTESLAELLRENKFPSGGFRVVFFLSNKPKDISFREISSQVEGIVNTIKRYV